METTERFGLPLLVYGQGQKDVTHNEALVALDCLLHVRIESAGLARPPADPQVGSAWLVGESPEAEWAGRAGHVACLTPAGWRFFAPVAGLAAWNAALGRCQRFDGTTWRLDPKPTLSTPAAPTVTGGSVVDVEARTALAAIVSRLVELGLLAGS